MPTGARNSLKRTAPAAARKRRDSAGPNAVDRPSLEMDMDRQESRRSTMVRAIYSEARRNLGSLYKEMSDADQPDEAKDVKRQPKQLLKASMMAMKQAAGAIVEKKSA